MTLNTKIELEYPYSNNWNSGYLVTNGEGRKTVILYNSNTDRSSTAYARYLVSVSIGRFLTNNEQVDHIDHDKTNDQLENLQILTLEENRRKEAARHGRIVVEMQCPVCDTSFVRRKGASPLVRCKSNQIAVCSKSCKDVLASLQLSKEEKINILTRQKEDSILFRSHE